VTFDVDHPILVAVVGEDFTCQDRWPTHPSVASGDDDGLLALAKGGRR